MFFHFKTCFIYKVIVLFNEREEKLIGKIKIASDKKNLKHFSQDNIIAP